MISFNDFLQNLDLSKYLPGLPPIVYSLIYALITVLVFVIGAKVVYYVIEKKIMKIAAKTKTKIDDKILRLIRKPIYYVMILFGIRLAIHWIEIPPEYLPWIDGGVFALIVLIAFYVFAKVIDIIVVEYLKNLAMRTETALDEQILVLVDKFLIILVYAVGIIIILGQFGIEITPLIASLGIIGLVIAFAAQESLANIFGGIFLMIDQSFKVGDRVKIGEYIGDIISIGLRSTKIRTRDGNILTIPNAELSKKNILNYSVPNPQLRIELKFGVAYGTDLKKAIKIIEKAIKTTKGVVKKKKPQVIIWEFGDSAIILRALFWVEMWKKIRRSVIGQVNEKVWKEFKKAKIEIPYPITHVILEEMKKKMPRND